MSKSAQAYKLLELGLDSSGSFTSDSHTAGFLMSVAINRIYDLGILETAQKLREIFDGFKETKNQKIIDLQSLIQEIDIFFRNERRISSAFKIENEREYYGFMQTLHALSVALGSIVDETQRLLVLERRERSKNE